MSETVKTTTVYPDYYFSNIKFELLPFVSICRETDNRTVSYCKKRYKLVYRYIDTALVSSFDPQVLKVMKYMIVHGHTNFRLALLKQSTGIKEATSRHFTEIITYNRFTVYNS